MLIIGSILQVSKVCESNKNANEFKLYKREFLLGEICFHL